MLNVLFHIPKLQDVLKTAVLETIATAGQYTNA